MISVIVPVYKVEKYLGVCVESILRQTYGDFELLLVDDGSPDSCGLICDEYVKRDNRVRVIHKENGGLSEARNTGLALSRGEYVAFVDSDDYVHPDYLACLLSGLETCSADICVGKPRIFHEGETPASEKVTYACPEVMGRYEAIERLLLNVPEWFTETAWCKLYKKVLFDGIGFPEGKLHEDSFTTYKVFFKARTIAFIDNKIYFYRIRKDSIMNRPFNAKRLDAVDAGLEILDFVHNHCDHLLWHARYYLASTCLALYNQMAAGDYPDTELRSCLIQVLFRRTHPFRNGLIKTKQKIWLLILRINPRLYGAIYKIRIEQIASRRCPTQ